MQLASFRQILPLFSDVPVRLDWLIRYEPVVAFLVWQDLLGTRIIDFGSGDTGLGGVLNLPFIGVDTVFHHPPPPQMARMTWEAFRQQEVDADVVIALDVFEHLPWPERADVAALLSRRARRFLLVSYPAGPVAQELDAATFLLTYPQVPDWLWQHFRHALPADEVPGFTLQKFHEEPHEPALLHLLSATNPTLVRDPVLKARILDWANRLRADTRPGASAYRRLVFYRRTAPGGEGA
ncbi:protein of unknown function [Candidatus Hydrogenisulfobacillus filiaventi]|uniref:Class I SAM-dependent methyltransferase n=1 Tax=Candidatus Hydrogenisulfobacillus filiaventi TaxID=2707344 RepID=A0A6F8ZE32_9FIRM|nr:protein of unknown function [Candidatus Hydrogenisulfobacillus filiaventi]